MQISAKRFRSGMLAIGIILAASVGVSATAEDNEKNAQNEAYLENIITVLRAHVLSMRAILDHDDMKYADNMVRHAKAFKRAVGMVGPMDWHAARAFEQARRTDTTNYLTEAEFEELAKASHKKIKAINRAANRYLRDKDGEHMSNAISNMIESCGDCHSKLPKGTVPSVWKGMK